MRGDFDDDHVILIDGSSYIYRAFHSLPELTRRRDGLQVNAVYGFCNMLFKLLREVEQNPSHIAVIFDAPGGTFRTELYKPYKAHRPAVPTILRSQFSLVRLASAAFNLPSIEKQGFEADDLIATYARLAVEEQGRVTIVSPDKDLMQLIEPGVLIHDPMRKGGVTVGHSEVIAKFGVEPDKVVDVQSLLGDTTDNVPGVPGVGIKTAAKLIAQFGSLEGVLRNLPNVKPDRTRFAIEANAERARISKQLVTLDRHVDVAPLETLRARKPNREALTAFLEDMEFFSLLQRVQEAA